MSHDARGSSLESRRDPDEPQQNDKDDKSQLGAQADRLDLPAKLEDAVAADP